MHLKYDLPPVGDPAMTSTSIDVSPLPSQQKHVGSIAYTNGYKGPRSPGLLTNTIRTDRSRFFIWSGELTFQMEWGSKRYSYINIFIT